MNLVYNVLEKEKCIMNQGKIGKFISECRRGKQITQEQLAEQLGVTSKSVSRFEGE